MSSSQEMITRYLIEDFGLPPEIAQKEGELIDGFNNPDAVVSHLADLIREYVAYWTHRERPSVKHEST